MFYVEDFDMLAKENENFDWALYALIWPSNLKINGKGYTGFIHHSIVKKLLAKLTQRQKDWWIWA